MTEQSTEQVTYEEHVFELITRRNIFTKKTHIIVRGLTDNGDFYLNHKAKVRTDQMDLTTYPILFRLKNRGEAIEVINKYLETVYDEDSLLEIVSVETLTTKVTLQGKVQNETDSENG